jgi:ELWxxDGT repeat protein
MATAARPAFAKNPRVLSLGAEGRGAPVRALAPLGQRVLIVGNAGGTQPILRVSDGTPGGTQAFAALPATDRNAGEARILGTFGESALVQDRTQMIWRTDGTLARTQQVAPGFGLGSAVATLPSGLVIYQVQASASGGEPPFDLVRSDGSRAGTARIAGATRMNASNTLVDAEGLYFVGTRGGLKRTDGTTVRDIAPTPFLPTSIARCGTVVYVGTADGLARVNGDGSVTMLADVVAKDLACAGRRVVFRGFTAASGNEPWVSDGTVDGTRMLVDIAAGPDSSLDDGYAEARASIGTSVLFAARSSGGAPVAWVTDGTPDGTSSLAGFESSAAASLVRPIGAIGTTLYFAAGANGRALYAVDAGASEARRLAALTVEPRTREAVVAGGKLFAPTIDGRTLWVFDPAAPVAPGDGAPDDVPFTQPDVATPDGQPGGQPDAGATNPDEGPAQPGSGRDSGAGSGPDASRGNDPRESTTGDDPARGADGTADATPPTEGGCSCLVARSVPGPGAAFLAIAALAAALARRARRPRKPY